MSDKRLYVVSGFPSGNLWRIGGDHQDALVLRGWRLSNKTWNPKTSPWTKQLLWLRIVHSGDWCLCLVPCTPGDACQKRRRRNYRMSNKQLSKEKGHLISMLLFTTVQCNILWSPQRELLSRHRLSDSVVSPAVWDCRPAAPASPVCCVKTQQLSDSSLYVHLPHARHSPSSSGSPSLTQASTTSPTVEKTLHVTSIFYNKSSTKSPQYSAYPNYDNIIVAGSKWRHTVCIFMLWQQWM